jgi:Toprim-like
MTPTRYQIRDMAGKLVAVHVRLDSPDGKRVWWMSPNGTNGLPDGIGVRDLPLFGSELVPAYGAGIIVVTEGEKDAAALLAVGVAAVGTVTGAATVPHAAALAPVARNRAFVLWPDNDPAGWAHMVALADVLRRAGARSRRMIDVRTQDWDAGFGAANLVAGMDPQLALATVATLVDEWSMRPPEPPRTPVRTWAGPKDDGSVSDALYARYGVDPGRLPRNVRCPRHDDRHPSLSILADDGRAICHSPGCAWSHPGVTASRIRDGA